jgi:hypothetical protein
VLLASVLASTLAKGAAQAQPASGAVVYRCEKAPNIVVTFSEDHALLDLGEGRGSGQPIRLAAERSGSRTGSGFRYRGDDHLIVGKGPSLSYYRGYDRPLMCGLSERAS